VDPSTHPINADRKNEYLSFFKTKLDDADVPVRSVIKAVIDLEETNYKSFNTFKTDFSTAITASGILDLANVYVWTEGQSDKSQWWMLGQAVKLFPELKDKIKGFFNNGAVNPVQTIPADATLVFFDDMSYSGTQLVKDIKANKDSFRGLTANRKATFKAIVVYVTTTSKAKLETTGVDVFCANWNAPLAEDDLSDKLKNFNPDATGPFSVYLDSKVADFLSIKTWVARGQVPSSRSILTPEGVGKVGFFPYVDGCLDFPFPDVVCPPEPYKTRLSKKLTVGGAIRAKPVPVAVCNECVAKPSVVKNGCANTCARTANAAVPNCPKCQCQGTQLCAKPEAVKFRQLRRLEARIRKDLQRLDRALQEDV